MIQSKSKYNSVTNPKKQITFLPNKRLRTFGAVLSTGLLITAFLIFFSRQNDKRAYAADKIEEPALQDDGTLYFINGHSKDTLASISVEIADNPLERERGLMYRHKLADNVGMDFIYDTEKKLTFWMKNTYIPLDIMYVDAKEEIVTILENTIPLDETSLPSEKPVLSAIEVNAGFCRKFNIKVGDWAILETE